MPIILIVFLFCFVMQSRRKVREPKEENVTLGPAVRDGEHVFGVARIFASFNDTFIVSTFFFLPLDQPYISAFVIYLGFDYQLQNSDY